MKAHHEYSNECNKILKYCQDDFRTLFKKISSYLCIRRNFFLTNREIKISIWQVGLRAAILAIWQIDLRVPKKRTFIKDFQIKLIYVPFSRCVDFSKIGMKESNEYFISQDNCELPLEMVNLNARTQRTVPFARI